MSFPFKRPCLRLSRIALHLLVAAFCFLCCAHLDAQTNRFVQGRFAIGFWVDPPADDKMEAHYQEIAAANFTFALGGFGAATPTNVARQLAYCEKLGLKAIVAMAGLAVDKLPTNNACWGYLAADEPAPGTFPDLRQQLAALRAARPGKHLCKEAARA